MTPSRPIEPSLKIVVSVFLAFSLAACLPMTKKEKDRFNLLMSLSIANIKSGDQSLALEKLFEAEKINNKDPILYNLMGLSYFGRGINDKAIASFKRAIDLKGDYAEAYNNLGAVYIKLERWNDALEPLRKAADDVLYLTPEYSFTNLGWVYYKLGDKTKALDYYKRALRFNNNLPITHYDIGLLYYEDRKLDFAHESFTKAVSLIDDFAEPHYYLGLIYKLTGRNEEARKELKKAIKYAEPTSETKENAKSILRLVE